MRIRRVYLENIRSHVRSRVEFGDGFNCIVGGLGQGKSSILYAIDFGLFGERMGRSYDYLLREDQNVGKIVVEFEQGGKIYRIMRALHREKGSIRQDTGQLRLYEGSQKIADRKTTAVLEQLKAISGLDVNLFRDVVWIQQERLKELLNMDPRTRQQILDALFGLSDFEKSWDALRDFHSFYEGEKSRLDRDPDIVGVDRLHKDHDEAVEGYAKIQQELENLRKDFVSIQRRLEEAEGRLKDLEELRTRTEELKREVSSTKARLEAVRGESKKLMARISEKENLIKNLEDLISELKNEVSKNLSRLREADLKPSTSVDELKSIQVSLMEEITKFSGEQEALRRELEGYEERKAGVGRESRCPLCLQPLTKEYRGRLIQQFEEKRIEGEKRIVELQTKITLLSKQQEAVGGVSEVFMATLPRIKELSKRKDEESASLSQLRQELGENETLGSGLEAHLASILDEIAKFDLKVYEKAKVIRDEAYESFAEVKHKLEAVKSIKDQQEARIEELRVRLDQAEEKMERKRRVEAIIKIISDLRDLYRSVQPKLRDEYIKILQYQIQRVLDDTLAGADRQLFVKIDERYTPNVKEGEYWREVAQISGGERTLLAFAYKIGLGQLILEARTGHGLDLLILDEPTESLGTEDESISRLADVLSKLESIEQIVAVTHSEEFADKADHIIRVRKEAGRSLISAER